MDIEQLKNNTEDELVIMSGSPDMASEVARAELTRRLMKSIKDMDNTTSKYSKVIIILTIVLMILGFFQLMATILGESLSGWWAFAYILLFLIVVGYSIWYLGDYNKRSKK